MTTGSEHQSTGQKGKQISEITRNKLGVHVVGQQVCLFFLYKSAQSWTQDSSRAAPSAAEDHFPGSAGYTSCCSPRESHGPCVFKWATWLATLSSSALGTASPPQPTRRHSDLGGLRKSLSCENWGKEGSESSAFPYHLSLAPLPCWTVGPRSPSPSLC